MATNEVVRAALIRNLVYWQKIPQIVAQGVTNGKFSDVTGKFLLDGTVVLGHDQFCDEGFGASNGPTMADVITAENGVGPGFGLELQFAEIGGIVLPGRSLDQDL